MLKLVGDKDAEVGFSLLHIGVTYFSTAAIESIFITLFVPQET